MAILVYAKLCALCPRMPSCSGMDSFLETFLSYSFTSLSVSLVSFFYWSRNFLSFLSFSCFAMLHLYYACRIFMFMIELPFPFVIFLYFFVFFVEVSSVYRAGIDLHYKRIIQNNINFICKPTCVYMCKHTCRLTIIRANRRTNKHTNKRVSYFLSD